MEKNIVFCVDQKYITDLAVAIKSLVAYNDNLNIYVINTDISSSFFLKFNEQLVNTNSTVIDWKIAEEELKWDASFEYISKISYACLLIPELLPHLKKALYLDCDIVVDDNLDKLFQTDLQGKPLGMAIDWFKYNTKTNRYNSGVILIDCDAWREKGYVEGIKKEISTRIYNNSNSDDQSVINGFFDYDKIYELSIDYNAAYGIDTLMKSDEVRDKFINYRSAKIIHFTGPYKPYINIGLNMRGSDKWWDFYFMSVRDALQIYIKYQRKNQILVYTRTEDMRGIVELAQAFPHFNFFIAAPTKVSLKVLQLGKYRNIYIKKLFKKEIYDFSDTKAILTIGETRDILEESKYFNKIGVPMLTYKDLAYAEINYAYQADNIGDLITEIKENYS